MTDLWHQGLLRTVIAVCVAFVVLTAVAMVFYPGGTTNDPCSPGYAFFRNFFSDLGRTESISGEPSLVSSGLFTAALGLAGAALVVFFVALGRLFGTGRAARVLGRIGTVFGVISGACFLGIAATPVNLRPLPHFLFVYGAFGALTVAVLLFFAAMRRAPAYPRPFAYAYLVFASLLAAYLVLISVGPSLDTALGELVQATGQKVIVYACLASTAIQALGALRAASRHRAIRASDGAPSGTPRGSAEHRPAAAASALPTAASPAHTISTSPEAP